MSGKLVKRTEKFIFKALGDSLPQYTHDSNLADLDQNFAIASSVDT